MAGGKRSDRQVNRRAKYQRASVFANLKFGFKLLLFAGGLALLVGVLVWFLSSYNRTSTLALNPDREPQTWGTSNAPLLSEQEDQAQVIFVLDDGQIRLEAKPQKDEDQVQFGGPGKSLVLFSSLRTGVRRVASDAAGAGGVNSNGDAADLSVPMVLLPSSKTDPGNATAVEQLGGSGKDWVPFGDLLDAIVEYASEAKRDRFIFNFGRQRRLLLVFECNDYEPIASPANPDDFAGLAQQVFDEKSAEWKQAGLLDRMDIFAWLSHGTLQRNNLMDRSAESRSIFRHFVELGLSQADSFGNRDRKLQYNEYRDYVERQVAGNAQRLKTWQKPVVMHASQGEPLDFEILQLDKLENPESFLFRAAERKPLENDTNQSLDNLWQRLEVQRRPILLEAPSQYQQCLFQLVQMERLWSRGLLASTEYDQLTKNVNAILEGFESRYGSEGPGSLPVHLLQGEAQVARALTCSLWESRYDQLLAGESAVDAIGILRNFVEPDAEALREELQASQAADPSTTIEEKVARELANRNAKRAEALDKLSAEKLWLALCGEGAGPLLSEEILRGIVYGVRIGDGVHAGLGSLEPNGPSDGLLWMEMAFLKRLADELDWGALSGPAGSPEAVQLAIKCRSQSARIWATLHPGLYAGFDTQLAELERQQRLLEDRLLANDFEGLRDAFGQLGADYDALAANYAKLEREVLRQRRNLIEAPHRLKFFVDTWESQYCGSLEPTLEPAGFKELFGQYLERWQSLRQFQAVNGDNTAALARLNADLEQLWQEAAAGKTSFHPVSPEQSQQLSQGVKLDNAEDWTLVSRLLQSPFYSAVERAQNRVKWQSAAGQSAEPVDSTPELDDELAQRPLACLQLRKAMLQKAGESARMAELYHVPRPPGIEPGNPGAFNLPDSLAVVHNQFEVQPESAGPALAERAALWPACQRYCQAHVDRVVLDFWALGDNSDRPQQVKTNYFADMAELLATRHASLSKRLDRDFRAPLEPLDLGLLTAAKSVAAGFGQAWQVLRPDPQQPLAVLGLNPQVDLNPPALVGPRTNVYAFARFYFRLDELRRDGRTAIGERQTERDPLGSWSKQDVPLLPGMGQRLTIAWRGHEFSTMLTPAPPRRPTEESTFRIVDNLRSPDNPKIEVVRVNPRLQANIVLVLDCSSSMRDDVDRDLLPEGFDPRPKSTIALDAINELLRDLAGQRAYRLNMIAFGASNDYKIGDKQDFDLPVSYSDRWTIRGDLGEDKPEKNLVRLNLAEASEVFDEQARVRMQQALEELRGNNGKRGFVGQTPLYFAMDRGIDQLVEMQQGDEKSILVVISDGLDYVYTRQANIAAGSADYGALRNKLGAKGVDLCFFNFGSRKEDFGPIFNQARLDEIKNFPGLVTNLRTSGSLEDFFRQLIARPGAEVRLLSGENSRRSRRLAFGAYRELDGRLQSQLLNPDGNAFRMGPRSFSTELITPEAWFAQVLGREISMKILQDDSQVQLKQNDAERFRVQPGMRQVFVYDETAQTLRAEFDPEGSRDVDGWDPLGDAGGTGYYKFGQKDGAMQVQLALWNPDQATQLPEYAFLRAQFEGGPPFFLLDYRVSPSETNRYLLNFSSLRSTVREMEVTDGSRLTVEPVLVFDSGKLWDAEPVIDRDTRSVRLDFPLGSKQYQIDFDKQPLTNSNSVELVVQVEVAEAGEGRSPDDVLVQLVPANRRYGSLQFREVKVARTRQLDSEGELTRITHRFEVPVETWTTGQMSIRFGRTKDLLKNSLPAKQIRFGG